MRASAPNAKTSRAATAPGVVARLELGNGPGQVGMLGGDVDSDVTGPNAITTGADGQIYVLDNVNGRLLRVNPRNGAVDTITVTGLQTPIDLVRSGTSLYVWDGGPKQLEIEGNGATVRTSAERTVARDDRLASKFEEFGHDVPPGEPVRQRSGRRTSRSVSRPGGEAEAVDVSRSGDRTATVTITPATGASRTLTLEASSKLAAVRVLALDDQGRTYVMVEQRDDGSNRTAVTTYVLRYTPAGKADAAFVLPLEEVEFVPNRFVTVSDQGDVFFLKVQRSGVEIERIAERAPNDVGASRPSARAARTASVTPEMEAAFRQALDRAGQHQMRTGVPPPRKRREILQAADAFRTVRWTLADGNYRPHETSDCSPPSNRWKRPARLESNRGKPIEALPYNWGGFDSVAGFSQRIASGAAAGNVCTCRQMNCIRNDAAGIDCSGFVSRAWGVGRYTTSSLDSIGEPVASDDLKPGDALNKPGSHVRLYVSDDPDTGLVRIYESSVSCGGVCLRDVTWSNLNGYHGVRRQRVED
jgi:cell wall-associated NlpC family hydrolase